MVTTFTSPVFLSHFLTAQETYNSTVQCVLVYILLPFSLSVPTVGASFGPGYGLINLDGVQCVGTESRLVDCVTSTSSAVCSHNEDAGVKCYLQTGMEVVNYMYKSAWLQTMHIVYCTSWS